MRQDEIDQVRDRVFEMVNSEKSFTAFDVTKALGKSFQRPHWMIKQVVHEMFANGEMLEYVRNQVLIPGAPRPALLYHLPENDPQDYISKIGKPSGTTKQAKSISVGLSIASSDPLRVSCDNRIYIPRNVATQWGLAPGQTAFCLKEGDKIILKKKFHNAAEAIRATNAPVDAKGNIRINPEVTTQFQEKSFKLSQTGNEVVLEPEA